jgi:hypothetical protein
VGARSPAACHWFDSWSFTLKIADNRFPTQPDVDPAERKLRICLVYGRTPLSMRHADQLMVAHLIAFVYARGHIVDLFYVDTGGEASAADRWISNHTRSCYGYKFGRMSALRGLARVLRRQNVPNGGKILYQSG